MLIYWSIYVRQSGVNSLFNSEDSWIVLSSAEQTIKSKVEKQGVPLKDWDISINRGILTGLNDAFIITGAIKDELIASDSRSAELIRPILRGRDIKRYEYTFADLWLIATFPSRNYDINDYPAIKKHLLSFGMERLEQSGKTFTMNGERVKARKKTNNKWFETQDSIQYWDDFLKQKIVYREISESMDACIVEAGVYVNNKCYLITGEHLIYLLSIFNSKLFTSVFLSQANTTGGKGFSFLERIKIPYPDTEVEKAFIDLYNLRNTMPADKAEIDKKVDNLVYEIYTLTSDEIECIERSS